MNKRQPREEAVAQPAMHGVQGCRVVLSVTVVGGLKLRVSQHVRNSLGWSGSHCTTTTGRRGGRALSPVVWEPTHLPFFAYEPTVERFSRVPHIELEPTSLHNALGPTHFHLSHSNFLHLLHYDYKPMSINLIP